MSFGQKILAKYGYKEGSGLGKREDGITAPIKANFKFDNAGLGDKGPVKEDHWWERVFNEASTNVNVQKSKSGVVEVDLHDKDGVEITNKSYSMKKLKESKGTLQYGSFLKSATLLANVGTEEEIEGHLSTGDIEIKPIKVISDEDLFKACGGRTAHKGARHGLNLSGKLKRIAEQERILLEKMKDKVNKHEVFTEPYAKKAKVVRPVPDLNTSKEETDDDTLPVNPDVDYVLKPTKERKRRDKKNEKNLVAKINTIGLDEPMDETEQPLEEEKEDREGTPIRKKKKKSKKAEQILQSICEFDVEPESSEGTPKRKKKKKKNKRKLESDFEEAKEVTPEPEVIKYKKVKLNDSYEASDDEEDIVDRLNALRPEPPTKHKKRSKVKRDRKRQSEVASMISEQL